MSIPCPNKSFKSDINQEFSDWQMLVNNTGSEEAAMAEFILNGFDLPDSDIINGINALQLNNNEIDLIDNNPKLESLTYPIKDLSSFNKNIEVLNINEEAKETFNALTELHLEQSSYKDIPENIAETYNKLLQIMPANYLQVSEIEDIEGIRLQELIVKHPMSLTNIETKVDPTLESINKEGTEVMKEFDTNLFSTFYSTTPLEEPTIENDTKLNEIIHDVMTSMGVQILQASNIQHKNEIDFIKSQIKNTPYLRPGMEDKVYAFIRFLSGNGKLTTSVVLNEDFTTSHLYEEAGHLLTFYLKELTEVLGANNITGVERLWQIPNSTQTDYLAQTDEYKVNFGKIYQKQLARITSYTDWLKQIRRDMDLDPERLDIPLIDGQPDKLSSQWRMLHDLLVHPENQAYLNIDWNETVPGSQYTRAQLDALTYARIEIAGQILGKSLLASARNQEYEVHTPIKGLSAFLTKLVRSLDRLFHSIVATLRGRRADFLRKLSYSNPSDPYLMMMLELSDKFMDTTTRKAVWENPKRTPISATTSNITFGDNAYLENISIVHKNQLDQLISKIPEYQKVQIDDANNELLKIYQSPLLGDRQDAIDLAYANNQFMNIGGINIKIPPEIFTWFYTQDPKMLKDLMTDATTKATELYKNYAAQDKQNKVNIEINRIVVNAIFSEMNKDPFNANLASGVSYEKIYSEFLQYVVESIKQAFPKDEDSAPYLHSFANQNLKLYNLPGQGNFYNNHQIAYNNYLEKQNDAHKLEAKLNKLVNDVNNNNKESVLRWFLLGSKVDFQGTIVDFPPLITELYKFNDDISLKDSKIKNLYRDWQTAVDLHGESSIEAQNILTDLRNEQLSKEDFIFYKGKKDYFQKIYDAINIPDVRKLFQFQNEKDRFDTFKKEGKEALTRISNILDDHQSQFLAELVINIMQKEKAGHDLSPEEYNEAYGIIDHVPTDMAYASSNMRTTHFNNDPLWNKISSDLIRKNTEITNATTERFKKVNEIYSRVRESLLQNPTVRSILKETATKNITELFHEQDYLGKRTHYFINKNFTKSFDDARKYNLQEIYEEVNSKMENRGYLLRLPLGDTPVEITRRNELINSSNKLNPYMTEELSYLRKEYAKRKLIHDLTYWQPKENLDEIVAKKEAELSPFDFTEWKRKTHKKYLRFTQDPENANKQIIEEVPYYAGELVEPAFRAHDTPILVADFNGKSSKNKKVILKSQVFTNYNFELLNDIPEFKELYNEMALIQEEAYELYRDKNYLYDWAKAHQTWAFAGDVADRINRIGNGNARGFLTKIKDEFKEVFKIAEEEVDFRLFNNRLPVKGRTPYENPNVLSDNYIALLEKGWHSAKNYNLKKADEYEMETIRAILKAREYGKKETQRKALNKENEFGASEQLWEKSVVNSKDIATVNNAITFIDNRINDIFYGERTETPTNKFSVLVNIGLKELRSLVSYFTIRGKIYPALAARAQAAFGIGTVVAGGMISSTSSKSNIIGRIKDNIAIWREELKGQKQEYWSGEFKTKNTLISEALGLIEQSRSKSVNYKKLGKFVGDGLGYGNMKWANNAPARYATRVTLEGLKWIDEASLFMNPTSYHEYLVSKSPKNILYIDDYTDKKTGVTSKGTRTLFDEIPMSKAVWNMFQVVKTDKGGYELEVVPGNEDKITNYTKAMFSEYVRSVHGFIDMKILEQPAIYRNPWVKALFALKNFIFVQYTDLFIDYFDAHKQIQHKSQITIAWNLIKDITNWLSFSVKNRKASGFFRASLNNYYIRNSAATLSATAATLYLQNAIAGSLSYLATKFCFNNEGSESSYFCKPLLWASILNKRIIAEIGSRFDPIKMLQNFDKPFAVADVNLGVIQALMGGMGQIPWLLYNMFTNDQEESGNDVKTKGPYKGMGPIQEIAAKYAPLYSDFFPLFNTESLIQRDQNLSKQLNMPSVTHALAHVPFPLGTGAMIGGYLVSPANINWALMKYIYKDDRFVSPNGKVLDYPPVRRNPIKE